MPEKHHLYTAEVRIVVPHADVRLVVGGDSVANSYTGSQRLFRPFYVSRHPRAYDSGVWKKKEKKLCCTDCACGD